jgi:lipid A ethanolaminephosphotransferase
MHIDMPRLVHPADIARPALLDWVRRRMAEGWRCRSDTQFALGVSLLWLVFYNAQFWMESVRAMWHGSAASVAFLASLFILGWAVHALLLLSMPTRRSMIGMASVGFVIAATCSFFTTRYGVLMNEDMLRNVLETDLAEAQSLLSTDLLLRIAVLGVVPALLMWKVRLAPMRWTARLRRRTVAVTLVLMVCAAALLSSSAGYAVYFREHKPVRYSLLPIAPIVSAVAVLVDRNRGERGPLIHVGGVAQRTTPVRARPLVVVLVVGETARGANFQLGGYRRATNPELSAIDNVVYFPQTFSCGTATAVSVPCMFSHLPRSQFDVDTADRYTNLLDALQQAGVQVEWRDNNSGCKGVCARVPTIAYRPENERRLCPQAYCHDEVMLSDLATRLADTRSDSVIVMHQIGSHGPAYSERYPQDRERFTPACHSNQLQRCTREEVRNAYDNTIAYTDHVLARTIQLLRSASSGIDTMLIYVSDHGESLGEQGLYLHGVPYAFAPDAQKRVPMLIWLSPSYTARQAIDAACLRLRAGRALSHDNLYHTMLGAAEVGNGVYDRSLDILAPCRGLPLPGNHE